MSDAITSLLKEARKIIRAHARGTSQDWDRRATAALAEKPSQAQAEPAPSPDAQEIKPSDLRIDIIFKPMGGFAPASTSGIRVVHLPTGIFAEATEARSQHQNRDVAFSRLLEALKHHGKVVAVIAKQGHTNGCTSSADHMNPPQDTGPLVAVIREMRLALDELLTYKPLLGAMQCGSTTLGNHRAELGAVLKAFDLYGSPPTKTRHDLQATGSHPSPCARFCEAQAFKVKIRSLEQAEEGAKPAYGHLAEQKQYLVKKCAVLRSLLDSAHQSIRNASMAAKQPAQTLTDEQERKEFEVWASDPVRSSKLPLDKFDGPNQNGGYMDPRTYSVWYGWKSKAAHNVGGTQ